MGLRLLTSGAQTTPKSAVNTGQREEEVTQTTDANTRSSPLAPYTNTACTTHNVNTSFFESNIMQKGLQSYDIGSSGSAKGAS